MRANRRTILVAGGAMVGSATLTGCLGDGGVVATTQVELVDREFSPKNIRVEEGTPVLWENHDDVPHRLVSASGNWTFDQEVDPGNATSHEFSRSGVYQLVSEAFGDVEAFTGMRMQIQVGDAEIEELVE